MADDTTLETTPTTETPTATAVEKKTRKPRTPKVEAEAATSDVSAQAVEKPAKKTRAKWGSKIVATKAGKSAAESKKVTTPPQRAQIEASAPTASVEVIDDIADLIRLEEENKQLRKQLSEKLRTENADLRKRLGQG